MATHVAWGGRLTSYVSLKPSKIYSAFQAAAKCQSTALHCTALHCTASHCTASPQDTALHCTALHCSQLSVHRRSLPFVR
jgi:hypothetical protein